MDNILYIVSLIVSGLFSSGIALILYPKITKKKEKGLADQEAEKAAQMKIETETLEISGLEKKIDAFSRIIDTQDERMIKLCQKLQELEKKYDELNLKYKEKSKLLEESERKYNKLLEKNNNLELLINRK